MIDESFHIPVLTEEVIQYLSVKSDGNYLDATAGFGGNLISFCNFEFPQHPKKDSRK